MQIPIFKNFLATSYFKAFVINALVISLITVMAMTTHISLHSPNGTLNKLSTKIFNKLIFYDNNTYSLHFWQIVIINFIVTFFSVLIIMLFLYILIGFGGGLVTSLDKNTRKQIPFTDMF